MANNVYRGRRYVPKIMGTWDNTKQTAYEPLSIVQWGECSYTSKIDVPVGIDILNEKYWVCTGNYNAQVEYYRQETRNVQNDVNKIIEDMVVTNTLIDQITQDLNVSNDNIEKIKQDMGKLFNPVFTEEELISTITLNNNQTITIPTNINLTMDLRIPQTVTLKFIQNGMLTIKEGVTLTMDGVIDSPPVKIFVFESSTSNITVTPVSFAHDGDNPKPMNGGYFVYPDWFGALPDGRPSNAYNSEGLYLPPKGTDNTIAFKRCVKFCEDLSNQYYRDVYNNVPRVIMKLRPCSSYLVKGNNPLGIQSTNNIISYVIGFEGNGSVIIWEPSNQDDVLFDKYGRVKFPHIQNLNVLIATDIGNRWGTFIRTKTNEGDSTHSWSQGVLKNIRVGSPLGRSGVNIMFDIDVDSSHSLDDQTILENVHCGSYNKFLRIANREGVSWNIKKTFFGSNTDGATHIEIIDGFSGNLIVDSCDILLKQANETFLMVGDNVSFNPIKIINSRLETRDNNSMCFINAKSGMIVVDNLNFLTANINTPNGNTRTAKLGIRASAEFTNCRLYDNFDVFLESTISPFYVLKFVNCAFVGSVNGGSQRTFGYPSINYINSANGLPITLETAIKTGKKLRKISVELPRSSDGSLALPIEYGSSTTNPVTQNFEVFGMKSDGSATLNLPNNMSLPPNIVITSVKLYASNIDSAKVNQILIQFYADDGVGTSKVSVWKDITTNDDIIGANILGTNNVITLPFRCFMRAVNRGASGDIIDESAMPIGWIELTYKSITKRQDLGSNNLIPTKKTVLETF